MKRAESGGFLHLWTFSEKAEAEVKEKTTCSTKNFLRRERGSNRGPPGRRADALSIRPRRPHNCINMFVQNAQAG